MQKDIQPKFEETTITCACGNVFTIGSTKKDLKTDSCSMCHPFFTGMQKQDIKGGRADRFKARFNLN